MKANVYFGILLTMLLVGIGLSTSGFIIYFTTDYKIDVYMTLIVVGMILITITGIITTVNKFYQILDYDL